LLLYLPYILAGIEKRENADDSCLISSLLVRATATTIRCRRAVLHHHRDDRRVRRVRLASQAQRGRRRAVVVASVGGERRRDAFDVERGAAAADLDAQQRLARRQPIPIRTVIRLVLSVCGGVYLTCRYLFCVLDLAGACGGNDRHLHTWYIDHASHVSLLRGSFESHR
jgi:hypothetical protein